MSKLAIDYLASALYQIDCKQRGEVGVRWGVMRTGLKTQYRSMARNSVALWAQEEEKAAALRQQLNTGGNK